MQPKTMLSGSRTDGRARTACLDRVVDILETEGSAVLSNAIGSDDLTDCLTRVKGLFFSPTYSTLHQYFVDDDESESQSLVRIEHFVESVPSIEQVLINECVDYVLRHVFEGEYSLFKDKINVRAPGSTGFGAHQDAAAGWTKYASRFVSVGMFLEYSDPHCGGLEVVSGRRRRRILENTDGQLSESVSSRMHFAPVVLNAGDVVFVDGLTPHRSATNSSPNSRFHVFLTFNAAKEGDHRDQYYEDKRKSMSRTRSGAASFRLFDFGQG